MDWSADSISCVTFTQPQPSGPIVSDTLQLWLNLFGAPPQAYNQFPGGVPGSQASGRIGDFLMVITAQPGRTELALHPSPSNTSHDSINVIGAVNPFPPAITDILGALDVMTTRARTFVKAGAATRMGILINLSKRADNATEAVTVFQNNTGILPQPGASDLNFAYNIVKKGG